MAMGRCRRHVPAPRTYGGSLACEAERTSNPRVEGRAASTPAVRTGFGGPPAGSATPGRWRTRRPPCGRAHGSGGMAWAPRADRGGQGSGRRVLRIPTDIVRACRSLPPSNFGSVVENRLWSPPLEAVYVGGPPPADHGGLPRRGPPEISIHCSGRRSRAAAEPGR